MGTRSAVLAALAALLAGDGAGNVLLGQSPPQFDSSLKVATMAAVQRALGNMAGAQFISGTTVMNASYVGQFVQTTGASSYTVSMPPVVAGGSLTIWNNSTAAKTLSTAANGGQIGGPTSAAGTTSMTLQPLCIYEFVSDGFNWILVGGSATTSFVTNGYQLLQGGLFFQWGRVTTSASGYVTWTFPIAFPNGAFSVIGSAESSGSIALSFMYNSSGLTKNSAPIALVNSSNAYVAGTVDVFAIGY